MSTSTFVYEKLGVKITAPALDSVMTAGFLRKHRKDNEIDQMFSLVELALDEKNLAVFDKLPLQSKDKSLPTMDDFYTAWQEDAGITAGE